jgi:hypothetical protein
MLLQLHRGQVLIEPGAPCRDLRSAAGQGNVLLMQRLSSSAAYLIVCASFLSATSRTKELSKLLHDGVLYCNTSRVIKRLTSCHHIVESCKCHDLPAAAPSSMLHPLSCLLTEVSSCALQSSHPLKQRR